MRRLTAAFTLLFPLLASATPPPPTLLEMVGAHTEPASLSDSVLVVIDAQKEYVSGALPLINVDKAISAGSRLLERARAAGAPIVHVVHRGGGPLFNPSGPHFSIVDALSPQIGETVIEKTLPNAFAGTQLQKVLDATGRKPLIIFGFMPHMCVSATVRAALDLGYATTVVADATATRDLPDGLGGTIPASVVQQASLAALADRFATVVQTGDELSE